METIQDHAGLKTECPRRTVAPSHSPGKDRPIISNPALVDGGRILDSVSIEMPWEVPGDDCSAKYEIPEYWLSYKRR